MSLYVQSNYVTENYTRDSITIDWPKNIIYIPRDELTLVQTTPTEIRNLDLNWFRLQLKALEDSPEGMTWLKTHNHNTEVLLGGLTYARVIEILEPYTITFEDGQYAVNLVGANSNVGDRVNVNQVSVRSSNSAGLISSPAIEFASFNGGVIIDVDNGVSGTAFPRGTEQMPVNNIYDALLICEFRGFKKLYLHSDITLDTGALLSGFELVGQSHVSIQVTIEPNAIVDEVTITNCDITGTMDGYTTINNCVVTDIVYMNGHIHNCELAGTINLAGGLDAFINSSAQLNIGAQPIIDMGQSEQNLVLSNYTGIATIRNFNSSINTIGIGLAAGYIVLDSTSVTAGNLVISGIGELIDQNGNRILSGVWNGGVNIENNLLNRDTISEATQLSAYVYIDAINGVSGTTFPIGTKRTPVNNIEDAVIIANDLGINDLFFLSDYTIGSDVYITGFGLMGAGINDVTLTFVAGCLVPKCHAHEVTIKGNLSGIVGVYDSRIDGLGSIGIIPSSQEIIVQRTLFTGIVTLPSNYSGKLTIIDCYSNVPGSNTPTLDFGNSTAEVQLRNYTGGIQFRNATEGNVMSIDLLSGNVKLEDSMTNATIVARGSGKMVESSTGNYIPSGIWNGGVNISNDIISKGTIAEAVETQIGAEIQYSVYGSGVWIDSGSTVTGTTYPSGSKLAPVNNLTDAIIISNNLGFKDLYFLSNFTFDSSVNILDFNLNGMGKQVTTFTFDGAIVGRCIIKNAKTTGNLTGVIGWEDSHMLNVTSTSPIPSSQTIVIAHTVIEGTLSVPSNFLGQVNILDCWAIPDINSIPPIFDFNNANADMQIRNLSGIVHIKNCTNSTSDVRIFLTAGGIVLDSTVTAGVFRFGGVGTLTNNSTSVTSLNIDSLMSKELMSTAIWDESISDHLIPGSTGLSVGLAQFGGVVSIDVSNGVSGTTFPIGTSSTPVNNIADAKLIANNNGINKFYLLSNLSLDSTNDGDNYTYVGSHRYTNTVTLDNVFLNGSRFSNCTVTGNVADNTHIETNDCVIIDLHNVVLISDRCVFGGVISLGSSRETNIYNSFDLIPGADKPIFEVRDCLGFGVWNWFGGIMITDMTNANSVVSLMIHGRLTVDATDTHGSIIVRGTVTVYGETGGTIITDEGAINKANISQAVWDESLTSHTMVGTTGRALSLLQFDGKVWLDPTTLNSGIDFPTGTQGAPVNNGPDAVQIAIREKITEFKIQGQFVTTTNLFDYTISGDTFLDDGLTFNNNVYSGVTFKNLRLDGVATFTNCEFVNCYIENLEGLSGELINCRLANYISIPNGGYLSGVEIVLEGDNTVIDNLNVPGTVSLDVNSGYVLFTNCVTGVLIEMNLKGGEVELDSTCVGGEYYFEGIGTLINNSTMAEKDNHLLALETIPGPIWDEPLTEHTIIGSTGKALATSSSGGVDYGLLAQAVWDQLLTAPPANDTAAFILKQIATLADELHKIQGLSTGNPMNVTPTSRTSGGIILDISGDGKTTTTVTRQ